jgi:hypothetical protein
MENQQVLNSISTLAGSIDPLVRAKEVEAVKKVVEKLLQLVSNIKTD